jgi:hypothetical protein
MMPAPSTDYTRCRTYGHAWFEADSDWTTSKGVPLTLRCERCMTERREAISRSTGELVYRTYKYSDGYAYGKGQTPTRDDFRLALLSLRLKEVRAGRRLAAVR